MMKFLCIGAFSLASLYYSQSYPVSEIAENLKKNASAVIRNESTVVEINKIDEIVYKNLSVITILNKDAISYSIPKIFYEKGDVISNVKVTIFDDKGAKMKSFSKSDFSDMAANSQGTFYSDNRVMALPYTPTSFPYTVEFSYEQKDQNTVFIPDFTPFDSYNISLQKSSFKIINKSGINLRSKTYDSPFQYAAVQAQDNGNEKLYTYQNIPAIDNAELVPNPQKILPKVSFSLDQFNLVGKKGNITSWKDFGLWYHNNLLTPVSVSTPQIKSEIAALHLSGSTEEKVKKIYQYMQSKTRYIFVALGIGGWQPMMPDEVQKKGYGDCKGLSNYMKTLLDEAGIPSYYAIINSNSSPISFDVDFPKMAGNHVILVIPTEKGNIWLENTSQDIAFNHLSYSTTDRNVLAVKSTGIDIMETPSYTSQQSKEKQVLTVQINPDKTITGKGKFSYTGNQYDFNLFYVSLSQKEKNDAVKSKFSHLNFENVEMNNFTNNKDLASIDFDLNFKASNYSKAMGDSFIFRAVPIYSSGFYHTDENRQLPFENRFSYEDDYEIEYQIPTNYVVEEMPQNGLITSDFGTYLISFVKKEDKIIVKRSVNIKKGIYSKEKYNEYVNFRKKIISADNSKILISKKS
ncbi:GTPase [Chryseobacterium sp. Hurlbut01]|nr:GTPase [Chryseobacterium sp. Hurlbut01]